MRLAYSFIIPTLLILQLLLFISPLLAESLTPTQTGPVYVGVAKYYDNRRCAVTVSLDDLAPEGNSTNWQNVLSMLAAKRLYATVAIITNPYLGAVRSDWRFVQYWINHGYLEAGSHSRNHVHVPYNGTDPSNGKPGVSYGWQINGSRNDLMGNLTLPWWQRSGNRSYIYSWIEPYASVDSQVLQWLGRTHYIVDRGSQILITSFADWDANNHVFAGAAYTEGIEAPWVTRGDFYKTYIQGGVYHFSDHPGVSNWTRGGLADVDTTYISNRTSVWYVPLGLLYLYHWAATRNITTLSPFWRDGMETFGIGVNATNHLDFGLSYPLTYVFRLPVYWTNAAAYYHNLLGTSWTRLPEEKSSDFFNGVQAARFNFTEHKAYISLGFGSQSDYVYLELTSSIPRPMLMPILTGAIMMPALLFYRSRRKQT